MNVLNMRKPLHSLFAAAPRRSELPNTAIDGHGDGTQALPPRKPWQIWRLQSAGWGYCALATAIPPQLQAGRKAWRGHLPARDRYGEAKVARLGWATLQVVGRAPAAPGVIGAKRALRCLYQPWSLQFRAG